MSAITTTPPTACRAHPAHRPRTDAAWRLWATLSGRRLALAPARRGSSSPRSSPRILFALVIAPALAKIDPGTDRGVDYRTFVIVGTVGLLVPLTCTFAGHRRDRRPHQRGPARLLAAPMPRA